MHAKHVSDTETSWLLNSSIAVELSVLRFASPLKLVSRANSKHSYEIFPLKFLSKIGMAVSLEVCQWMMVFILLV